MKSKLKLKKFGIWGNTDKEKFWDLLNPILSWGDENSLESENKSLEKNIQLFEQGLAISKKLQEHLESAEKKIEVLSKDQNGDIKTEIFEEK